MTTASSGIALTSGALAGLSVDMVLYPLDTLKTRLQSAQGFRKAGGFSRIYSGVGSAAAGSMPGAALFFCTYELVRRNLDTEDNAAYSAASNMVAAAAGEVAACLVRVPTEVVKQRAQASGRVSSLESFKRTFITDGFRGFYRGYFSTVMREIPFSVIQFPLWEFMKRNWSHQQNGLIAGWQSAVCGAASGGIAAAITTPLDVAKTRIMLAKSGSNLARGSILFALNHICKEKGLSGLFSGIVPRVLWISLGGAIFLGVYDKVKNVLCNQNIV